MNANLRASLLVLSAATACDFKFGRLVSPGEVFGRVVVSAAGTGAVLPAAGAHVSLLGTTYAATVAADGKFAFEAVPAGSHRLFFELANAAGVFDHAVLVTVVVRAGDGRDLGDVTLSATGRVTGHVTLNGAPAARARVAVPGVPLATTTDAAGAFVLPFAAEGTYVLAASAAGAAGVTPPVKVVAGATAEAGTIALRAGAAVTLSGSAASLGGAPIAGAAIKLVLEGAQGAAPVRLTADPGGAFSGTVAPGLYRLTADAPGYFATSIANVAAVAGADSTAVALTASTQSCTGGAAAGPCACGAATTADASGDGLCNAAKPDRDGDGVPDQADNCPDVPNPDQHDASGDGIGDACKLALSCPDLVAPAGTVTLSCAALVDAPAAVTWSWTGSGLTLDTRATPALTLGAGDYAFQVAALQAKDPASATLHVHVTGTPTAGVPDPTASTLAFPAMSADGGAPVTVTVTAKTAAGLPLAGVAVHLDVSPLELSAATGTVTQPSPTGADGATTGILTGTRDGGLSVKATLDPGGANVVLGLATFTVLPGTLDAAHSTASLDKATIVGNGADTATLTVTVVNTHGAPMLGVTPLVNATGANVSFAGPSATDVAGVATVALTSRSPGVAMLAVSAGGVSIGSALTLTVTSVADAPDAAHSLIVYQVANPWADGATPIPLAIVLKDAANHPLAGATVTLSSSLGAADTITQPTSPTDATGATRASLVTSSPGSRTLTATTAAGSVSKDIFTVRLPDPAHSSLTTSPTTVYLDGSGSGATVTVHLADAQGQPLQYVLIQLATTSQALIGYPNNTDQAGNNSTTVTDAAEESAKLTASVRVGSSTLTLGSATVQFFTIGRTTSVTVTSASKPADGVQAETIGVTLKDSTGTAVAGVPVQLVLNSLGDNPANAQLTQSTATTNFSGLATGSIVAFTYGNYCFTAQLASSGAPIGHACAFFSDGPPATATSHVGLFDYGSFNPTTDQYELTGLDTISVLANEINGEGLVYGAHIADVRGAGLPNIPVKFSVPCGTSSALIPSDGQGWAICRTPAEPLGSETVTAVADPLGANVPVTGTLHLAFVNPPAQAHCTLTPSVGTQAADGASKINLELVLADATGAPLAGLQAALYAADSSGNYPVSGVAVTGQRLPATATGHVYESMWSSVPGTFTLKARVDGAPIMTFGTVTFQ